MVDLEAHIDVEALLGRITRLESRDASDFASSRS